VQGWKPPPNPSGDGEDLGYLRSEEHPGLLNQKKNPPERIIPTLSRGDRPGDVSPSFPPHKCRSSDREKKFSIRIPPLEKVYCTPKPTWGFTYISNPKIFDKDPPLMRRLVQNESLPSHADIGEGGVLRPPSGYLGLHLHHQSENF